MKPHSYYLGVVACFLTVLSMFFFSCSDAEKLKTGNNIISPFAVTWTAKQANKAEFVVLNSGSYGEYQSGSLLTFEKNDTSKQPKVINSTEIPLLGNVIAKNSDGNYLAVGFIGKNGNIAVYKKQGSGWKLIGKTKESTISFINNLSFAEINNNIFLFGMISYSSDYAKKAYIWSVSDKLTQISSITDDIFPVSIEGSTEAFQPGSMSYLPDSKLLVVFPNLSSIRGNSSFTWNGVVDFIRNSSISDSLLALRSSIVIDLSKINLGQEFKKSYLLAPILVDENASIVELNQQGSRQRNFLIGTSISHSVIPDNFSCETAHIPTDSIFVFMGGNYLIPGNQNIYKISGWNNLVTANAALYSATDAEHKIALGFISAQGVLLGTSAITISNILTKVASVFMFDDGDYCLPAVLRIEDDTATATEPGRSKSWVQWALSGEILNPVSVKTPILGIGGISVQKNEFVSVSFATNALKAFSLSKTGDVTELW